jgi:hypothetical protein
MMLHLPKSDRPDALVITDDALVSSTTAALVEAGAADAFEIVAHANFPAMTASAVTASRIGYDVREVLRICTETLDRLRTGQHTADASIPVHWENTIVSADVLSFLNI